MARQIGKLSARKVATATGKGLLSDGGGLYLQISGAGTKRWIFRFGLNGRTRDMGLGSQHTLSLAEAREAAKDARKLLLKGIDPIEARKAEKAALFEAFENLTENCSFGRDVAPLEDDARRLVGVEMNKGA